MFSSMLRDFSQFASVFGVIVTIVATIYAINTFNIYPLLLSLVFIVAIWFVTGLAKWIS